MVTAGGRPGSGVDAAGRSAAFPEDHIMRTWLCAAGLLLAGGAAVGGDAKDDIAKLQGTWTNEAQGKRHEMKFTKDQFTLRFADGQKKASVTGTFKIDASKKPKHIDMSITEADGLAERFKGMTAHAIYDLDGDTFKWCASQPGKDERPSAFPAEEGEAKEHLYLVFRRAK
jgi:uncharacterized protein (TIGR03067 family)